MSYQKECYKIMRKLLRHRIFLMLATCGAILIFLYNYSNVGDILGYLFSLGPYHLSLSLQCNTGRLGNQMCTYASLYGLSAVNGRRPFIALSCNIDKLKSYFDDLTATTSVYPSLYFKWNTWSILSYLRTEDTAIPHNSNFITGFKYPCSYTFFDHVKQEIRREFTFRKELTDHARKVLQDFNNKNLKNVTYIGVHVRRGDYLRRWLNAYEGLPVNMEYFERAISYFSQKYNPVIFVGVSDDREWCVKYLARLGVQVAEVTPTPAHDLAILASCNHTIMTYGTFGFWGAYLAGGEVLYFDRFLRPGTNFTTNTFIFEKMYPPDWKGIVTVDISLWANLSSSNTTMRVFSEHW